MLQVIENSLNPYSNGSYFLTMKTGMLTLWLSRLNPYSNGSYFLTIMTRKQFSKEQHRLNPYSNGSYFLTV